jgi:hypothetical protein
VRPLNENGLDDVNPPVTIFPLVQLKESPRDKLYSVFVAVLMLQLLPSAIKISLLTTWQSPEAVVEVLVSELMGVLLLELLEPPPHATRKEVAAVINRVFFMS